MSRRKPQESKPGDELTTSFDNTLAEDGSKKRHCPGCGLLRDVRLAETTPCCACGALGTQKTMPLFDEDNEPMVAYPLERPVLIERRPPYAGPDKLEFIPLEQAEPKRVAPRDTGPTLVKHTISVADLFLLR